MVKTRHELQKRLTRATNRVTTVCLLAVPCALLGIWTGDVRWLWTALLIGIPACYVLYVLSVHGDKIIDRVLEKQREQT